jgi:hypothetical protein
MPSVLLCHVGFHQRHVEVLLLGRSVSAHLTPDLVEHLPATITVALGLDQDRHERALRAVVVAHCLEDRFDVVGGGCVHGQTRFAK